MNDEATLTIKMESSEDVQPGRPRPPAPPAPSALPISKSPVQPPVSSTPTQDELNRLVSLGAGFGSVPLKSLTKDLQKEIVAKWRAEAEQQRGEANKFLAGMKQPQGPTDVGELARLAIERDRRAMEIELERRRQGAPGIGTRGDVLLREKERRDRLAAGEAPHDENWAKGQAMDAMARESDRLRIHHARMELDSGYLDKETAKQEAKAEREAQRAERLARQQEREAQRRQREAEKGRPHDLGWAMERVKAQMAKDRDQQMLDQARRQLDPTFAKRKEEEAQKKADSDTTRNATFTAMALGAAGMPGLARIPAMYATGRQVGSQVGNMMGAAPGMGAAIGGPVGAVVAAVQYAMDKVREGIEAAFRIGGAMLSLDPDRLARGFADLVSKVPLLGGLMGAAAHGVLDFADAIHSTAQRLSAYSGILASQLAQQDIIRIQRDIFRAQQFGPQIAAAENVRFAFEQRLENFMDRHMPTMLTIATAILDAVSDLIDLPGRVNRFMVERVADVIEAINTVVPGNLLDDVVKELREIAANTDPNQFNPNAGTDPFMDELLNMHQGLTQVITPAPAANQPFVGVAPVGGQL